PLPNWGEGPGVRGVLLRIINANVFLDHRPILRNINWQMNEDENWAIGGPNGAGKSTLLKLILGELHPARGGHIHRFNSPARESLWQIKRKIGFVSTDLQARYHEDVTAAEVIASGFFSSIGLIDEVTPEQWRRIRELIALFKLEALASQSILRMSYGQARKVLIARALVTQPRILLLDEPFDGLDRESKDELTGILRQVTHSGARLILVSHHTSDLLPLVTHSLRLQEGRIVEQGRIDELR
ncbi:MAG: ATP-binding cassette domain-containing protein, partial [Armatimonadota bacterium]|nr:ATP-binding cassette domain-containing protein [Armatimonadota bacterium]